MKTHIRLGVNNTEYGNRAFVYEVEGLRQRETTDKLDNSIRKSGTVYITVPYARMNQEMRRITRMGGKIVSIKTLDNHSPVLSKTTNIKEKLNL